MNNQNRSFQTTAVLMVGALGAVLLLVIACLPAAELAPIPKASTAAVTNTASPPPSPTVEATPAAAPVATDSWLYHLSQMPYPYTTPLPPQNPTALDGIYAKLEPKEGTPVPCRRCPDYLPEGGVWKLNLDKGVFRIFHQPTRWRSLGSFTVEGNRFFVFNDPACYDTIGVYTWTFADGELKLQPLEDTCQVDRRARSLSTFSWSSCQPQSEEAAVTDHWPKPAGCELE